MTIDAHAEGEEEDFTLALLDAAGNETLATGTTTDSGVRLDWLAEGAGEAYRLRVEGTTSGVDLTFVNLVRLDNTALTVEVRRGMILSSAR